jgi:hypothetical protein
VVCCTAKQARAFFRCNHLEIDMSFKMVAGKTNIFSVVGWDDYTKRMLYISYAYALLMLIGILTYCYVFTNMNTRLGYKDIFKTIFNTLGEAGRSLVHFPYFHFTESGIRTIGLDMCKKQAGGRYTHSIC